MMFLTDVTPGWDR